MNRLDHFFERLATLQHRRAATFVLVGVALAALSVPLITQLGLDSAFEALLPRSKPSVQDLERIEGRVGGLQTLTVAIQSADLEAMQRFAGDLVPALEALPEDLVASVDWNVASFEDFVWEHRHLYADLEDLRDAERSLRERLEYEKVRNNPFYFQLDDEVPPDPREVIERIRSRAEEGKERMERFPGGYYVHPDGDLLAIFLRSDIRGGNAAGVQRLMDAARRAAEELDPESYAPDLTVEFGGPLLVSREEHQAIVTELAVATSITVVVVLLVIIVFFRKVRSIFLIGTGLFVPVLITFAFAELAVDDLNTSTAFLGSIIIGNGINPNIIWLARYFEERRGGLGVREAIAKTHQSTWAATLTASLAAAIAYASLIITDFKGFSDFGIIGGFGMVACWIGAFAVLPAITALNERFRPLVQEGAHERGGAFGAFFDRVVHRGPRTVVGLSAVTGALTVGLIGWAIANDPLEYDFRNLKSVREGSTAARRINDRVGDIVSSSAQGNGIALVLDRRDWVEPLYEELVRLREEEGAPWGKVRSIDMFLPEDQAEKIPLLEEIRALLLEYRERADEETRAEIDAHLPPETIERIGAGDLPEDVARPFTERDGTRGRIMVVEKADGHSVWDGRYLVEWAGALRHITLPDGSRPPLAGRAPVFADMVEVIWTDGPKAIAASFVATLLLVLLTFRNGRQRLFTMVALLLGIAWMGGTMALFGMKLNFLNFVAFPITFGNGVDYGVNVMRRYAAEREAGNPAAISAAIRESGGAVILCSLTTIIGYTSLYTSANRALNSFGSAMAISEVTCLLAAVLTMPALLYLSSKRRKA